MQPSPHLNPVTIGTRGSPLALVQARLVQRLLGEHLGIEAPARDTYLPLKIFTTTGDKLKGRLSESGGKGLFVKELDEALADGAIDLAVHSMKDVPTVLDPIFMLVATLEREDPRDAFISPKYETLMDLPKGAILGTASLRRQAQAMRLRPDLKLHLLRGNVGTRLARLDEGVCAATFLAVAGLSRLNQTEVITDYVSPETMLPAPAQGAVGVQIRAASLKLGSMLQILHHEPTFLAITAERAFLKALDGSCRTPIAALAEIEGTTLRLRGQALSPDGQRSFERDKTINLGDDPLGAATSLGLELGRQIKHEAGDDIIWDIDV